MERIFGQVPALKRSSKKGNESCPIFGAKSVGQELPWLSKGTGNQGPQSAQVNNFLTPGKSIAAGPKKSTWSLQSSPQLVNETSLGNMKASLNPSPKPTVVKKVGLPKMMTSEANTAKPTLSFCPPPPDANGLPRRSHRRREAAKPVKHFMEGERPQDKLVGVVITIFEGSSYDAMFREVKPTTVPGERVSTYSIACKDIGQLHQHLVELASIPTIASMQKLPCTAVESSTRFLADDVWRNLVENIRSVPADSVVFNWECCSGCGDKCFPCDNPDLPRSQSACRRQGASQTMNFMGFALRSGWTLMCSDFSLKSLIFEWSEEHLGPNPFVQVGICSERFCLEFVPSDLQHEEVPQQLQVVGELCADQGKATVFAMPDTIVYAVDAERAKTNLYDLKVLTVVTDMACASGYMGEDKATRKAGYVSKCSIGKGDAKRRGWAGHVALTYPSGGQLVTSMGHWIELSKIDASLESVLRVAEKNFGREESQSFRKELSMATSDAERSNCIQSRAHSMITKSMPSKMKCRTKY